MRSTNVQPMIVNLHAIEGRWQASGAK